MDDSPKNFIPQSRKCNCKMCGCLMDATEDEEPICDCCKDDMLEQDEPVRSEGMKTYIYDIEVFELDWIVVLQSLDNRNEKPIVIHNNNYELRRFVTQPKLMLGGFNNKHYDDWIIMTMITGGSPEEVKRHNDYIIKYEQDGWTYPFIQYQKRPFKSFDLKDDTPKGLSLKAAEGNMGSNILESEIGFDIGRKLTPAELEIVIHYCKTDVKNTVKLYDKRKAYIDSKRSVAKLKGAPDEEYIQLTNAKLTAKFLDAKSKSFNDEFEYDPPECLKIDKYTEVVEFFKHPVDYCVKQLEAQLATETRKIKIKSLTKKIAKIKKEGQYKTKLKIDVAGVPHVYGWGGVHGAKKKQVFISDDEYIMVDIDVGSYYPSEMLEFDYMSRAIPSKELYRDVYNKRIKAKHEGDSETAGALKLVLNTCYGAMKNKYNDLYDPHMANQVCITGQLLLTDLIEKLEEVESFELIQSNTDGLIIRFKRTQIKEIEKRVSAWEVKTHLNMEYTVIHRYIAKDVNNYVVTVGETYLVNKDGTRTQTKPDKNKINTKGGYVSLYDGGDFKNNSMRVVHKALVEYMIHGVPLEKTIMDDNEIEHFQIIAKTGASYDGTFWELDGKKIQVQKVNRVYSSNNSRYGKIYKRKNGKLETAEYEAEVDDDEQEEIEREDTIASLPEHCIIDNEGKLTINDIDKQFYIDMAKKRLYDYLGNKKLLLEANMAETKTAAKVDAAPKNIYQKLIEARIQFLASPLKKNGINRFAQFKYFELADIVPTATKIMCDLGLVFIPNFTNEVATGTLYNTDNPAETIVFTSPMRSLDYANIKGMNAVQGLGGEETYQRRYLYMMLLDIVENDTFDATSGSEEESKDKAPAKKPGAAKKPATPEEREEKKKELTNVDGEADEMQIKSIKSGLKKLQTKDEAKYTPYITKAIKAIKKGLTKAQAEDLLIEIGDKIEE